MASAFAALYRVTSATLGLSGDLKFLWCVRLIKNQSSGMLRASNSKVSSSSSERRISTPTFPEPSSASARQNMSLYLRIMNLWKGATSRGVSLVPLLTRSLPPPSLTGNLNRVYFFLDCMIRLQYTASNSTLKFGKSKCSLITRSKQRPTRRENAMSEAPTSRNTESVSPYTLRKPTRSVRSPATAASISSSAARPAKASSRSSGLSGAAASDSRVPHTDAPSSVRSRYAIMVRPMAVQLLAEAYEKSALLRKPMSPYTELAVILYVYCIEL
ncbi:PP155 [Orf virus]|uniref:PP155 n=1 Tax=Orf virus TaxID=10258 RepID=F1AWX8_ORFV|nr:PP155 [Orf virus]